MILFPNAKINIGLDILRRRPDGYHDISTVMCPVGWQDILEIVPSHGTDTTLTITGREVNCPTEKNLVMKAYRRLSDEQKIPPVDIYLHKVIPDGAGLGGGSADAAFTIVGLNKLFGLGLTDERMAVIAGSLGADCSFFIYNKPMMCEGIGTEMHSINLDISDYKIVIVKPNISVPTAQAYGGCMPQIPITPIPDLLKLPITQWQGVIKNDFEPCIIKMHPEIGYIKQRMLELGAIYAAMSGSGSAVYGLFSHDILAHDIQREFPYYDIFVPHD